MKVPALFTMTVLLSDLVAEILSHAKAGDYSPGPGLGRQRTSNAKYDRSPTETRNLFGFTWQVFLKWTCICFSEVGEG